MSTQDDKTLKRENELADLSKVSSGEIEALDKPTEHAHSHGVLGLLKEGFTDFGSAISGQVSHLKQFLHHNKENEMTCTKMSSKKESQEERESLVEKAKEKAHDVSQKISDALEEYPDRGNLSSETTIQPNKEGPSTLEKINEESAIVAEKVSEKAEEVKEKILPAGSGGNEKKENLKENSPKEGKSFTQKLQEGVTTLVRKISETFEETTEKLIPEKVLDVMRSVSDDMTLTYDDNDKTAPKENQIQDIKEDVKEDLKEDIKQFSAKESSPKKSKSLSQARGGFCHTGPFHSSFLSGAEALKKLREVKKKTRKTFQVTISWRVSIPQGVILNPLKKVLQ